MYEPDRPSRDAGSEEQMDMSVQFLVGGFLVGVFVVLILLLFSR